MPISKKKIYLIPGFGESFRSREYKDFIQTIKSWGFSPVAIKVDWREENIIDDYINEVLLKLSKVKTENSYALGFSFGAYILSLIANKTDFEKVFLCSISPYFKDDISHIPEEAKEYFGERFMSSVSKKTFPKIKKDAVLLVGEKDWPLAIERMNKSYEICVGKKLKKLVPNAGHDISDVNYVTALRDVMK